MSDARIPVVLLTGFLGSGKTTLLNRLLRDPALADSVVVVNEFGDVALDHLLITHVDEAIRLLDTGCVCCTVRGDLIDTLVDLHARRARGALRFSRVFVETSGLVDPTPIFHSFAADPAIVGEWRLAAVATTADAANGAATLARHEQARRQVALADLILVTKADIAAPDEAAALDRALAGLNPFAQRLSAADPALAPMLLAAGTPDGLDDRRPDLAAAHAHPETIASRSVVIDDAVPEAALLQWIELLAALRGEQLLRLKGLVRVAEDPDRPRLVQAVQHVVHPVETLDRWPSEDRRSRLVLIGEGLDFDTIERTLRKYVPASMPAPVIAA